MDLEGINLTVVEPCFRELVLVLPVSRFQLVQVARPQ